MGCILVVLCMGGAEIKPLVLYILDMRSLNYLYILEGGVYGRGCIGSVWDVYGKDSD